ncbi:MAG: toprim domain-containing protein [Candidatus Niyogibacteria bacterium]|nr:toprim domain-containing protein [Candidatus Niyogibacteria bacterium]
MHDALKKLSLLFERLPGIGPRQARRFVYSLVDEKPEILEEFAGAFLEMKKLARRCPECFRAFEGKEAGLPTGQAGLPTGQAGAVCVACATHADSPAILIAEKDVDLENIEKLGVYSGLFHVLGEIALPFQSETDKVRLKELHDRIKRSKTIKEVILATSATNEGDAVAAYVEKILENFTESGKIKITRLGRGLSTGSYLEFSDRSTLDNALKNRK